MPWKTDDERIAEAARSGVPPHFIISQRNWKSEMRLRQIWSRGPGNWAMDGVVWRKMTKCPKKKEEKYRSLHFNYWNIWRYIARICHRHHHLSHRHRHRHHYHRLFLSFVSSRKTVNKNGPERPTRDDGTVISNATHPSVEFRMTWSGSDLFSMKMN